MKIICTKEEKREIITAISNSEYCPLASQHFGDDCAEYSYKACKKCVEKYIEWVVTDNE